MLLILGVILIFGQQSSADAFENLLTKQRRELHETRRELGRMKEKCYQTYPQFFKADHSDYNNNLHCLDDIQKKDQQLRDKHKKDICSEFKNHCHEK